MKELKSLEDLKNCFQFFPTIGEKSAERMAYALLNMDEAKVNKLLESIKNAKEKIHHCPKCGLLTEDELCSICSDPNRDHSICIVLSNEKDVYGFENLKTYRGVYHVLGGDISPMKNIGPENLKIEELKERILKENIHEIIIATSPTIEGETTALYLVKYLADLNIKISRLAFGVPVGGSLDYVDEMTISRALDGRTKMN